MEQRLLKRNVYFTVIALIATMQLSFAQDLPLEAGGGNPGAVNRQYQDQYKDLKIEKRYIQTVPEDLDAQERQRQQQQVPKDHIQGGIIYNPHFKLNDINFQGNTIYSDKKLKSLASDLIGQEVYLEDILNYSIKVSRFYQQNGYLTTYAYVAPQEIQNGVVTIHISESRIAQKNVTGNFWVRKFYITNIATGGTHLSKGKVFNVKQLQGAMKQMNKEAYMQTSVAIEKDKDENTIIDFDVKDRFPLRFGVYWDDFGRDNIGRQRATMILGMDNLTGLGDKIYGGTILSSHSAAALTGYQIPISSYGTKLSFDYTHQKVNPFGEAIPLNIEGNSNIYSLKITQPFINTASTDLIGYAMIDFIDSDTRITDINENISDYTLRVARFGVNYLHDDRTGRWLGNLDMDVGIGGLGATPGFEGGPQSSFQKINGMAARVERLPHNLLGVVRINGQYTPQSLFAAEQMFIGGPYSIRGYQPTEVLGDYGIAGSVELRFPIPGLDKIKKKPEFFQAVKDRVRLLVFYDWGYVNSHHDLYIYPKNFLHSVGVGATISVMDGLSTQLGVGFPLGPRSLGEASARMYFTVNAEVDRMFLRPKSH